MKYKDPSTGNFKELKIRATDELPVGTEVDFDGTSADIPAGWEETTDPNEYSTTEKRVGTWINGKPIYRKTFQIPSSTYSSRRLDTDIVSSTVSQIWLVSPSFSHEYENGVVSETYNLLGGGYNGTSDWLYVRINHGENVITIDLRNDSGRMIDGYITLEYTKTTD